MSWAISTAASAASAPLLPASPPARSTACSIVSHRQQAEADGDARVERRLDHAPRGLAADVLEVRRPAANDAAERDDRLVAARLGQAPAGERQLPRPGHEHDRDLVGADAALHQPVDRAVEEPLDDVGVVPRRDDGDVLAPPSAARRPRGTRRAP